MHTICLHKICMYTVRSESVLHGQPEFKPDPAAGGHPVAIFMAKKRAQAAGAGIGAGGGYAGWRPSFGDRDVPVEQVQDLSPRRMWSDYIAQRKPVNWASGSLAFVTRMISPAP